MAQLLDVFQRFRKIEEATSTKDEPAPVYVLDELADLARSSPEAAQSVADHVVKRLAHRSPVVKFKALRVVKHLINKGCSQFQHAMQKNSTSVRELQHFRGEQDPFKGDAPNGRVREFSKEVLELLFNSAPVAPQQAASGVGGRIQGFGSNTGPAGPGQYGGIGSNGISSTGNGSSSSYSSGNNNYGLANTQPLSQALGSAANAIGSLWQRNGMASNLNNGNDSPTQREYASFEAPSYTSGPTSFAPVSAAQVMGSEDQAVDDICTPGGLRPMPDPSDLQRFVDTASNMDGLRIAELLREKLESPTWQVNLRAVCALEAVLEKGMAQACGEIAVMFQSDPSVVGRLAGSQQPMLREKAGKVYLLLTGEQAAPQAATPAAAQARKPAYKTSITAAVSHSLLGDEEPAMGGAGSSGAAGAGGYVAPIDLLGELEVPSAAPAPAAAAAQTNMFAGLQQQQPAVQRAPAVAAAAAYSPPDLLGMEEPVAAMPAAAPAPAPAPAAGAGAAARAPLDEMFAGLTTADPQPAGGMGAPQYMAQPQQHMGMPAGAAARPAVPAPAAVGDLLGGPVGDLLGGGPSVAAAPMAAGMPGPSGAPMQPGWQQQQQAQHAGMAAGYIPAAGMAYPQQQMPGAGFPGAAPGVGAPYGAPQPGWAQPQAPPGGLQRPGMHGVAHGAGMVGMAVGMKGAAGVGVEASRHKHEAGLLGGKHDAAFDFVNDSFKK